MPTPDELAEEERRVRQLRLVVALALNTIGQTDMSLEDARDMVAAVRQTALCLFPDKAFAFDLIYLPRFRRLLAARYGTAPAAPWSVN
ncbi:MAG: hypothetical protein HY712_07095 [candidate division NC10 bacterium]|nr:hypothetical protein [candidate division NC10 bacterium]